MKTLTDDERRRRYLRDERARRAKAEALKIENPTEFRRYRDRINGYAKAWRAAHPEYLELSKEDKERKQMLARARRANNLDRHRSYQRDFYHRKKKNDVQFNLRLKFDAAKNRAQRNGVPFDIEPDDIVIPEVCPILGIPLIWKTRTGKGERDHAPALDRIRNTQGYVKGNVQVISSKANRWKNDMTLDDAKRIVAYMELHEILS